ncbi:MAG: transcriptional regulator [Methanobrevibacter sp.]|jgi:DNA-binding transcriptional ArsR family regulator|nr:transcriptional regulator [Candidatus Methanoflexus mossambicus]
MNNKNNENYNENELFILMVRVHISKPKRKTLLSLEYCCKMPSEIAKDVDERINAISSALSYLKDNNLVYCMNEDFNKGRMYQITEKGKKVIKLLKERTNKLKEIKD